MIETPHRTEVVPEADLEGDDHLGVVHLLDVPQVQLAGHSQRATLRLLVFLGGNTFEF